MGRGKGCGEVTMLPEVLPGVEAKAVSLLPRTQGPE
jgi:hypothetical protein